VARITVLLLLTALCASALTRDELTLLQDPGGWKFMTITDADNGFETLHVCFDPSAPGVCDGNLFFRPDMTFRKTIKVDGKSADRAGTYQVDGNNVVFLDEFNNKDGPYTAEIDTEKRTLVLGMVQAGVHLRMELLLEKEFHKRQEERKKREAR
jgi:hypothetical protein